MASNVPAGLRRLSRLDDYEVEAGYPDIRGWRLEDQAGRDLDSVTDLLVDPARAEAVSVMIHRKDPNWFLELFKEDENGRLPLSAIALDEANQVVRVTRPIEEILEGRTATEEWAATEERAAAPGPVPERRAAEGTEETVGIVEERLDVKKARRKAGEVRVGKTVEQETVRRDVPVDREEVVVERERLDRPVAAAEAGAHFEGGQGEVIVPIYREEVEVTTRPVVAERLGIRKRAVQEARAVAADVRRERAVVEGADEPGQRPPKGTRPRRRA